MKGCNGLFWWWFAKDSTWYYSASQCPDAWQASVIITTDISSGVVPVDPVLRLEVKDITCVNQEGVVTLDHAFNNRIAVLSDNMNGLASLVKYVYSRGHRRIAYIHGGSTAVTESRLTGFYRACEELNLRVPKEYILSCEYHEPISCYAATKRVLTLPVRPTCVLFSDDYSYIGGLNAITDAGLRVPDDISVVGYDGIHLAKMLSPRLTTWQQNTEDLGRIAASRLIEKIEHPLTTPSEHIVVKGRLLEGETVADLNTAADRPEKDAT